MQENKLKRMYGGFRERLGGTIYLEFPRFSGQ